MRYQILSSVGAQILDPNVYQVSDLDDVDFYWEIDQPDEDTVFWPCIYIPFSPKAFDDLEMGGSAENPDVLNEEDDKANCPPTTPVSERPTPTLALLRSLSFGTRIENNPDYVYGKLFQKLLPCMCFNLTYIQRAPFYYNFFQKTVGDAWEQKQL